ncbi:MAG: hypothetical protein GY756_04710 [bacterium]|nr:hypothetical protein [bacterium]
MKRLFQYFTSRKELTLFEIQKIKALVVICFLSIIITLIFIAQNLLFPSGDVFTSLLSVIGTGVFTVITLIVLKTFGIKIAGNLFSIGIVLSIAIALNIINADELVLYKYIDEFYIILAALSINVLFATPRILIFNVILTLATTTRVYLYSISQSPENAEIFQDGFINQTTAVIIISTISYFTIKFAKRAINSTIRDAEINKEQNDILRQLVSSIKKSSSELLHASNQLSAVSTQISQGAHEQAATTEEISSSMEEMIATIISNTEQAENTAKISSDASEGIKRSKKVFTEAVNSVGDISEKALIISEIADKTDILSINAAIEAARAGKEGKGFAVVAQEVRKLAEKSKIASIEIEKLSKSGTAISQIATKTLDKVMPEILKSTEYMKYILASSKEQRSNAQLVNVSIHQLTEITNQNSASSEEMASSAEDLAAKAEQLNSLVSGFELETKEEIKTDIKEPEQKQIKETEIKTDKDEFIQEKGFNLDIESKDSDDEYETY